MYRREHVRTFAYESFFDTAQRLRYTLVNTGGNSRQECDLRWLPSIQFTQAILDVTLTKLAADSGPQVMSAGSHSACHSFQS